MITFCSLFSGSSGNAIFLSYQNTRLLIDAGASGKKIEAALNDVGEHASSLNGILVTHEHSDHMQGVGVMARRYHLPIYANERTWHAMEKFVGKVTPEQVKILEEKKESAIGDIGVCPIGIPHDAAGAMAYRFHGGERKVAIATDMGYVRKEVAYHIEGCDLVLLESNHDVEMLKNGRYPYPLKQRILGDNGHLSNEVAAKMSSWMVKQGTKHVILGHLSEENNTPALAYEASLKACHELGIAVGSDMTLDVAPRYHTGQVYKI